MAMKANATFKLGSTTVTVQYDADTFGHGLEGFFALSTQFGRLPTKCGNSACGKEDLRAGIRKAGEYEYFEIECQACHYRLQFGQLKGDAGGLFPKGWSEPYKAEDGEREARGGGGDGDKKSKSQSSSRW